MKGKKISAEHNPPAYDDVVRDLDSISCVGLVEDDELDKEITTSDNDVMGSADTKEQTRTVSLNAPGDTFA